MGKDSPGSAPHHTSHSATPRARHAPAAPTAPTAPAAPAGPAGPDGLHAPASLDRLPARPSAPDPRNAANPHPSATEPTPRINTLSLTPGGEAWRGLARVTLGRRPADPPAPDDAASTAENARTARPAREPRGRTLDRDRVLHAADALLHASGYDRLTIRDLARRLDCAVGSIYKIFPSKVELVREVVRQPWREVLDAAAHEPVDRSEARYAAAARLQPGHYRLLFWLDAEPTEAGPPLPQPVAGLIDRWAESIGRQEAEARWMMLHGSLLLGHVDRRPDPPRRSPSTPWNPNDALDSSPAGGRGEDVCLL